jgi:hypothetical protein
MVNRKFPRFFSVPYTLSEFESVHTDHTLYYGGITSFRHPFINHQIRKNSVDSSVFKISFNFSFAFTHSLRVPYISQRKPTSALLYTIIVFCLIGVHFTSSSSCHRMTLPHSGFLTRITHFMFSLQIQYIVPELMPLS